MGNGRGKLDIPYLAIFSVILLGAVAASLYFFPEWRDSPATMVVLVAAAIGGVVGLAANFRSAFIRDRADAPPPPLDYDSPQHRRNQENVTANVRSAWIDGVLRESLPERVRLELALDHPPGKLQRTIISVDGHEPRRPLESAGDIADIFRASGRALLILGAPGSGKTVTLLELCRPVLEGAEADPRRPVPVVLNLSTWAQKQAPLEAWIADEMWRQYGLNRQVTPGWLAADHLILLLDGLDEVAAEARDACVRAINAFRESHGAGMAVCSRSADYAELRERLALSNAVEIQPLTPAQIEGYLRDERLALDGVREAIARDDALRELATTPLMLNVMALAYGGRPLSELLPLLDNQDERRAHLYDAYLARMFRRKPLTDASYTADQALSWLRFLAARLTERDETQFFIEDMQMDWLPGKSWSGVPVVIVGNTAIARKGDILKMTSMIIPMDELTLDVSPRTIRMSIIVFLLTTVAGGVMLSAMSVMLPDQEMDIFGKVMDGMFFAVGLGILSALVAVSMLGRVRTRQSKRRNRPNEGIHRSATSALRIGGLTGILGLAMFSVLGNVLSEMSVGMLDSRRMGMALGAASLGLGVIYNGGEVVIKHYLLRLLLAVYRLLPLRLIPFLEAMRERILLQRAGAHYRFIHRTFQEHVVALSDERIAAISGSKTSEVF